MEVTQHQERIELQTVGRGDSLGTTFEYLIENVEPKSLFGKADYIER